MKVRLLKRKKYSFFEKKTAAEKKQWPLTKEDRDWLYAAPFGRELDALNKDGAPTTICSTLFPSQN